MEAADNFWVSLFSKRYFRIGTLIAIAVISFLMHFNHFSKELISIHVWRQTQTQSNIVNFYEEDMNILNPRRNDRGNGDGIFRMEFPLMQWLVACSYHIFGNSVLITRIIMFLTGLLSVLGMYYLLKNIFNQESAALLGAWAFNFSPCFYYYTINPLPDNMALCCAIWGLSFFFLWYQNKKVSKLILSGLFLSIAALCKLPFILYFIVPIIFLAQNIFKNGVTRSLWLQGIAVFSWGIFPLAWYAVVIPQWYGNSIVSGMLDNQDSIWSLIDYLHHNLISTLPELLLNYGSLPFFIAGFYFLYQKKSYRDEKFLMLLGLSTMVLIYFLFELNAIQKIHDYYLFPFFPLLFMLVAYGGYQLLCSKQSYIQYFSVFLLLILPITCYLRMQYRWDLNEPGFNPDWLIYKNELREIAPKNTLVVAGNDNSHFIMFYYIDKKGWGFQENNLTPAQLSSMISLGAEYLYTDSADMVSQNSLTQYIDKLLLERGSVRVYRLKKAI